jgi:hypothetical protein
MENDNINMDLKEIGFRDVDMIRLTQYKGSSRVLVNQIRDLFDSIKGGDFFWQRLLLYEGLLHGASSLYLKILPTRCIYEFPETAQ